MRIQAAAFALSALCLCGTASAQGPVAQKDDWAFTTTAKFEIWRDKASADIKRYEAEIEKCDGIISRTENIIRLAKQQGNAEAEATARKAGDKARRAKEEYLALRKAAERARAQAEAVLDSIRSAKKGFEAGVEQAWMEINRAGWAAEQGKLIQDRLGRANRWVRDFAAAMAGGRPHPPAKEFNELQPGDVLLMEGKLISAGDNLLSYSSGDTAAKASHTVLYLKEVDGKKLFLDNQPHEGPRIISEKEFLDTYRGRGAEVARPRLAQPLDDEEGDRLFRAAVAKAQENRNSIGADPELASKWKLWIGGTAYGIGEGNLVCSEVDLAVLNTALKPSGREIPKTDDRLKSYLGIDFSPADYLNPKYFVVTPLALPKSPGLEK